MKTHTRTVSIVHSHPARRPLARSIATLLAFGAFASIAQAVTQVWDASTSNQLATATNYVSNVLPVNGDTIQWNGTQAGNLTLTSSLTIATDGVFLDVTSAQTGSLLIDTTVSLRVRDITIAAGAGAFSMGDAIGAVGTSQFTLGGSGVTTTTFTNNSSNVATINSDVQFNNGGGVSNRTLVFAGTGNWTVNTTMAPVGSGTTNVTKSGSGTLTIGNANALGVSGRTFTMNGGSLDANAALTLSNIVQVWNSDFTYLGSNSLNMGTGTVSLGTTPGTSRTITTNGSGILTIGGIISNGTTATGIVKVGAGTMIFSGANTYTGTTTIQNGIMKVSASGAFGAGSSAVELGDATSISSNFSVRLRLNSATTIARDIRVGASNAATTGTYTIDTDNGTTAVGISGNLALNQNLSVISGTSGGFNLTGNITSGSSGTQTLTFNNTGPVTASTGIIGGGTGTIAVTKLGSGITTLSGVNTYTGATTVSAGSLVLSGSGSINGTSGVTVSGAGAKFVQTSSATSTPVITLTQGTLDGTGTVGDVNVAASPLAIVANGNGGTATLTTGALNFSGAATVNIASAAANTGIQAGALTTSGTDSAIVININRTGAWNNGANNLISFSSFASADINDFVLGTLVGPVLGARQSYGGLVLSGNNIAYQINGTSVYWTGLETNQWTANAVGGSQNWKKTSDSLGTDFIAADDVVFNDTPGTNQTLQINDADVSTTTMTFGNSTSVNYTVASSGSFGIIGGSLFKNGTGSLTINTNNTYGGGTTLNAGTINVNTTSALGTAGVTITGGTLDNTSAGSIALTTNNTQNWSGDFTFTGTNSLDMGMGAVTLSGTGSRTITVGANAFTVGEVKAAATQGLIKQGAGTLVVSSTGTGTNGSVLGGILNIAAGTLQINRTDDPVAGDFTATGLTGSGTVTNGAAIERWLIVNTTGTNTFSGTLANGGTGALGLQKQGTGTLILTGSNTYTGTTRISGGILNVQNSNALGLSATVDQANGARSSGIQLQGNISLPGGVSFLLSNDGGLQGTATIFYAIDNVSDNNTINGAITLTSGGGNSVIQSDSGTLTLAGTTSPLLGIGARTLILQGASAGANTVSGVLQNNTGTSDALSLTKSGNGTWTLTGANTYTGATTISGGTLNLTGSLGGTPLSGTAGTTISVAGGTTFTESVAAVIAGAGAITVAGTATLPGANTFTGKTTINAGGVLTASSLNSVVGGTPSSSLGAPTTVANGTIDMTGVAGNGTLIYTGTGETTDRVVNLAAGGNAGLIATLDQSGTGLLKFTSNFTATGAQTHTLLLEGSTAGTGEIAGVIVNNTAANNTSLTKLGTGTWTLSGANTFTGATTVSAGTLMLANVGALQSSTVNLAVDNGIGFASGIGTFNLGALAGASNLSLLDTGTTAVTLSVGANNAATTYSGILSGTGSALTKVGTGTFQLTGTNPNTYTGLTTVSTGILQLNKPAGINAVGGNINITGTGQLGLLLGEQIPDSATITFTGTSNDAIPTQNAQETIGSLVVNSTVGGTSGGQIIMRSGFTVLGATTLTSGILGVGSTHTATLNGVNITATDTTSAVLRVSGNTGASTLNIGPAGITASGGDIQVKFNTNNFDAVLNLGGNFTATGNVIFTNGGYTGASANVINLTATRTFDIATGTTTTVAPDISGAGGLTKTGNGTLSLLAASTGTYGGATTISAGTLAIASGTAIPDTSAVSIGDVAGAKLQVNANETIGSLSGGGATGGEVALGANTLTVGNAASTTFSGTISGATGTLTKQGNGTLMLNGIQTYGTLTTNAGTTNVGSAIGTGGSTVNANATTNFSASQTLAALNIGAGAVVTFSDTPPFAGFDAPALAVVPEPGSIALLFAGALVIGRRRRSG
jgi:autotransporter-associated beta strand protein